MHACLHAPLAAGLPCPNPFPTTPERSLTPPPPPNADVCTQGLIILWALFEYDQLQRWDAADASLQHDMASRVASALGRSCLFIIAVFMCWYAAQQLAAGSYYYTRSRWVGENVTIDYFVYATGIVGTLSIFFNALRRKAREVGRGLRSTPHDGQSCDCFITHDWGKDELGRDNHVRASLLNTRLQALGFSTWFDEDQLTGDINQQMARGIDHARVVVVCITKRYLSKVDGRGSLGDDDNW